MTERKRLSPGGAGLIVAVLAAVTGWIIGDTVGDGGFDWSLAVPFFAAAFVALALGFVADAVLDAMG
jgi:hypothetical protein